MLNVLLVHKTRGCIAQCQEAVIVRIHSIAVTWERVDEQLQLVVGSLADMDAHTTEGVLQMVRTLLNVFVNRH